MKSYYTPISILILCLVLTINVNKAINTIATLDETLDHVERVLDKATQERLAMERTGAHVRESIPAIGSEFGASAKKALQEFAK
jgi:hypothetical protein